MIESGIYSSLGSRPITVGLFLAAIASVSLSAKFLICDITSHNSQHRLTIEFPAVVRCVASLGEHLFLIENELVLKIEYGEVSIVTDLHAASSEAQELGRIVAHEIHEPFHADDAGLYKLSIT